MDTQDTQKKKSGRLAVIQKFFGYRPGDGLKEFRAELAKLSDADKQELAIGAAKNLGLSADEVDFPLN